MGVFSGDLSEEVAKFMPRLHEKKQAIRAAQRASNSSDADDEGAWCMPLIMNMDADSQFGQLYIFGMPFFRKYYTSFRYVQEKNSDDPLASSMAFSIADDKCQPAVNPAASASAQAKDEELDESASS